MEEKVVTAEPTAALKFIDGILHQQFIVSDGSGSAPEWRLVPSESITAPGSDLGAAAPAVDPAPADAVDPDPADAGNVVEAPADPAPVDAEAVEGSAE
jgi:hypothetical protein